MADETVDRVIAEAALARRFATEIDERASKADIPTLVENVESMTVPSEGGTAMEEIGFDTDGVPYLKTGE
jgi:hypothetical protein